MEKKKPVLGIAYPAAEYKEYELPVCVDCGKPVRPHFEEEYEAPGLEGCAAYFYERHFECPKEGK